MGIIMGSFDYQRFVGNSKLQAQIDDVYDRWLIKGKEIPDDELELSAAGEPDMSADGRGFIGAPPV